jgi:hypothetical protein
VHFWSWEGAEDAQLDGLDLLVVLARLESRRKRQIRRRRKAARDAARVAVICRGRRGEGSRRRRFIGVQLAVLGTEAKACRRRTPAESGRQPARIAAGPRWAPRGPTAGPARTWFGPSGSAQLDRIGFPFFKFF